MGEGHGEALGPWALRSDELGPNLGLSHLFASCVSLDETSLVLTSSLVRWRNDCSQEEDG